MYSQRWINYFNKIVNVVATNSPCIRRKVGAIIVKDKRILATGYNGLPSGFTHCSSCFGGKRKSGQKLHVLPCLHAELNCLIQCATHGISCKDADMFVSVFPCNDCLKAIIGAGIKNLYIKSYYALDEEGENTRSFLLSQAEIEVTLI